MFPYFDPKNIFDHETFQIPNFQIPNSKHTRVDREVNHGVRGISIVVSKFCPELSSLPFIQLASHLRYLSVVFHSTGKFSFMINSISL